MMSDAVHKPDLEANLLQRRLWDYARDRHYVKGETT